MPIRRPTPRAIVFWGGTGQAKVMRFVAEHHGLRIAAVIDDTIGLAPPFADIPLLCGKLAFERWLNQQTQSRIGFAVCVGNPHARARLLLHDYLSKAELEPISLIHPTAWIAPDVRLGPGAQIHAGVVVETGCQIGRQVIVNTRASVDHECELADGVEIGPGATICGLVRIGRAAWVGAGATVLSRKVIGPDSIVGAGSVVIRDVLAGVTIVGSPAERTLPRRETNEENPHGRSFDH